MTLKKELSKKQLDAIRKSRNVRRSLAFDNHLLFFSIYLYRYIEYSFAPFHYKMFEVTQDNNIQFAVLSAFRDSGKSTIFTTSLPIWAIVGILKKKFVVIASRTQAQAKKHLSNIKKELENNQLLKDDIGPFKEESTQWTSDTIVLSKYDARIMAVSTEQSIRGIRHGQHRPDLIICDDVEDSNSVKTKELRDKTWDWLNSEVIPTGSKNTKIIVVGNLLHEDSLIMRLKKAGAKYFEVALFDDDKNIAWPGKFPTWQDIEKLKATVLSEEAWFREYLLKIISDKDRAVQQEWLHFYEKLPVTSESVQYLFKVTAVDPAISEKDYASNTAILSAEAWLIDGEVTIFILPNPINKKMSHPTTVDTLKLISDTCLKEGKPTEIIVESVGYIKALVQDLEHQGYPAKEEKIRGDKRHRLSLTTSWLKNARVLFPRKGAEQLIEQITGLGIENYDDLADAFSLLVLYVMGKTTGKDDDDPDSISGPASLGISEMGMDKIWDMEF